MSIISSSLWLLWADIWFSPSFSKPGTCWLLSLPFPALLCIAGGLTPASPIHQGLWRQCYPVKLENRRKTTKPGHFSPLLYSGQGLQQELYHWTFYPPLQWNTLVSLAFWMKLLSMPDFAISCTGLLKNIGSLNHRNLPSVGPFHTISKAAFITINTNLIRKVFKYWAAVKLTEADTSFPKFWFLP